jgi:hypothetical protein
MRRALARAGSGKAIDEQEALVLLDTRGEALSELFEPT